MLGNAGDFHNIQTLLKQPGSGLMTQVVEAEVLDVGPTYCTNIGAFDGFGGSAGESRPVNTLGLGVQYLDGCRGQRYGP